MKISSFRFQELNENEVLSIDGGGPLSLLLSSIAISFTSALTIFCPPAGIGLFVFSAGMFLGNMRPGLW